LNYNSKRAAVKKKEEIRKLEAVLMEYDRELEENSSKLGKKRGRKKKTGSYKLIFS